MDMPLRWFVTADERPAGLFSCRRAAWGSLSVEQVAALDTAGELAEHPAVRGASSHGSSA